MIRSVIVLALAVWGLTPAARANDSEAGIAGGQLVLKDSADVQMVSEKLELAEDEVKVAYVFRNHAKKPVATVVAFPLPEICVDPELSLSFDPKAKDPLAFQVTVDGKAVKTELERKSREDKKKGETCYTLTYHWPQTFPAQKTVRISHRYRPANEGFFLPIGKDLEKPGDLDRETCIDAGLRKTLKNHKSESNLATARLLRYVLKTGANWKGSIETFELIVRKQNPKELVSLCWEGLKKTSPTTFEGKRQNFEPTQDLAVLFIGLN